MPYDIRQVPGTRCYSVTSVATGAVKAKCSTMTNARRQVRLLQRMEQMPGRSRSRRRGAGTRVRSRGGRRRVRQ